MGDRLAIVACDGMLPVQIAEMHPEALQITLAGVPHQMGPGAQEHRIEHLGALFQSLKAEGVGRLVFAGSLSRPALDPNAFDNFMMGIAPRLLSAMQQGDDALLRQVIEIFEEQGICVVGAHEVLPELTAPDGYQVGPDPDAGAQADANRAIDILQALSPLDIGQGCAVAGGQCLGIETVQGTDAVLKFVGQTSPALRRGQKGVYVKAAKRDQDLRVDMPAIGPATIAGISGAGLGGLVIEAGRVMILDRQKTLQAVEDAGLYLIARRM